MKWIPAKKEKTEDMFATITLHSFTLNSAATAEIIKIHGSHDYDLRLMVSECGGFVAVSPEKSKRKKINPQKTVTSSPIYGLLKPCFDGFKFSRRFTLESDGDVLFFKIPKKDK